MKVVIEGKIEGRTKRRRPRMAFAEQIKEKVTTAIKRSRSWL